MGPSGVGRGIPRVKWDVSRDKAITDKAKWLIENDPEVKAVHDKSTWLGWRKAIAKAAASIPVPGGGRGASTGDTANAQGDARLSRDAKIQEGANVLLATDAGLKAEAATGERGAYTAYVRALHMALREMPASKPEATTSEPTRAERLGACALTILKTDPELRELNKSKPREAHRRALKLAQSQVTALEQRIAAFKPARRNWLIDRQG